MSHYSCTCVLLPAVLGMLACSGLWGAKPTLRGEVEIRMTVRGADRMDPLKATAMWSKRKWYSDSLLSPAPTKTVPLPTAPIPNGISVLVPHALPSWPGATLGVVHVGDVAFLILSGDLNLPVPCVVPGALSIPRYADEAHQSVCLPLEGGVVGVDIDATSVLLTRIDQSERGEWMFTANVTTSQGWPRRSGKVSSPVPVEALLISNPAWYAIVGDMYHGQDTIVFTRAMWAALMAESAKETRWKLKINGSEIEVEPAPTGKGVWLVAAAFAEGDDHTAVKPRHLGEL